MLCNEFILENQANVLSYCVHLKNVGWLFYEDVESSACSLVRVEDLVEVGRSHHGQGGLGEDVNLKKFLI